mmetsp:Transcript_21905/g.60906  ORF Transcript_21905/g.60906 Transcript_21905/m.60906 type:complete len:119 (+) Transcript_21905:44-400(+)
MKNPSQVWLVASLAFASTHESLALSPPALSRKHLNARLQRSSFDWQHFATSTQQDQDCGCADDAIVFRGEPSDRAKSLNHREAIQNVPFCNVNGESVTMSGLLPSDNVSIVVFLRSLG